MNLPDDILREIFMFLPNEDMFIVPQIDKRCKEICYDKKFIRQILFRKHPMVFNILDNLCVKCNIQTQSMGDTFSFIHCEHAFRPH
jgi:hypothetical protein